MRCSGRPRNAGSEFLAAVQQRMYQPAVAMIPDAWLLSDEDLVMRSLGDALRRLATQKTSMAGSFPSTRLVELRDFGTNPGDLRAWHHVPGYRSATLPLVVALHGCTQTAAGFDHGTGWTQMAERHGFAVLLPEQLRTNNFNLCFNWYEPADSGRVGGEPASISQMVETMILRHGVDPAQVFVTGLSAGGAMTAVMLATYPELFAGGSIIAGLPYGCATNVPEAFDRMRGHGGRDGVGLANAVRAASSHKGAWPSVAVWHGTSDAIVDQANGLASVEQWRRVHGMAVDPTAVDTVDGFPHRGWRNSTGRLAVEEYRITRMGHGVPLSMKEEEACGAVGPYMLDVGISSTRRMAETWGLTKTHFLAAVPPSVSRSTRIDDPATNYPASTPHGRVDVGRVIEDALRSAGLMR